MSDTTPAHAGTTIGHYRVLGELGTGGMGVVFKAFDEQLERPVALKLLSGYGTVDAGSVEGLLHEARAASVLDHRNIVAVHAVEQTDDGRAFLVMAYCEGESLAARMRARRLSVPEAIDLAEQVGEGLAHAHAHNVIHRDIKPGNIILGADGTAKIVDFGLARHVSAEASTQSVKFAGTLSYMSPEQLAGIAVDARTDVWSLGVLLYEMLTGRLPFERENPAATIAAIGSAPPTPMPDVAQDLQLLVYRALAKRPQDRYQTAAELVNDLRALGSARHTDLPAEVHYRAGLAGTPARAGLSTRVIVAWSVVGVFVILWITLVPALLRWARPASGSAPTATSAAAHASYLRGVALLDRYDKPGNLDAAAKEFEATTAADPKFTLAYAGLCETYWTQYRYESKPEQLRSAEAACQRGAELNASLPAVNVALGRMHNGTAKHELALQEFERALQLDPHSAPALLGLGETYMALGRNEEAEAAFQRGIALRPEHWNGYYRLGAFYYMQQRYAEAAEQFRKVVALAPDHGLAHASLGQMLMNLGDTAEAEQELRVGLALAPTYAAYTNLGTLYFRQRRFADFAEVTEKALALNSSDYRVWDNLRLAYLALGQKEKAQQAEERAFQLNEMLVRSKPDDAGARADLALDYAQRARRKPALQHLNAAVALAPEEPRVLVSIGETYWALGDRAKGFSYVLRAVKRGYPLGDMQLDPQASEFLTDAKLRVQLQEAAKTSSPR